MADVKNAPTLYRSKREALGWSREHAAEQIGISDDKLERIENGAFFQCKKIDTLVIGPRLVQLGGAGTRIDSMRTDAPPFEQMNGLKTVQWLGGPPASGIPKALFWTDDNSASVTNYVYADYLDAWTNAINASGMAVGSAVAGTEPAVWPIEPNDVWHKGKLWLSLLPGHPVVEGAPVFMEPPAVVKRDGALVFRAVLAEGDGTDVFAVFSDSTGAAWTNLVASGVDGDPETVLEAAVPASLPADRTYSFAALAANAVGSAVREGAGSFFNGTVSVAASAAFSEADGTGSFTFSRNGIDGDLVVPFSLGGTAAEFVNFRELQRDDSRRRLLGDGGRRGRRGSGVRRGRDADPRRFRRRPLPRRSARRVGVRHD